MIGDLGLRSISKCSSICKCNKGLITLIGSNRGANFWCEEV